ncbi:hypothetical protein FHW89_005257 [Mucilaginibacter sp. SG564]|nr:hypothetical protein [Mucilaginibacter sp. SG564]
MGKDKKLCADVPTADLHILDFVNNWGQNLKNVLCASLRGTKKEPPLNGEALM